MRWKIKNFPNKIKNFPKKKCLQRRDMEEGGGRRWEWALGLLSPAIPQIREVNSARRVPGFSHVLVVQSCPTFCNPIDSSPPSSFVHGDSPGKNTGVGCHFLLQSSAIGADYRRHVIYTSLTSSSLRYCQCQCTF